MKKFRDKIKLLNKTALACIGFLIMVVILFSAYNIARAAWQEPSTAAPGGNVYTPLNVGPDSQARAGRLLLSPFARTGDAPPTVYNPLEVIGSQNVYINTTEVDINGNLIVDNDTLYVDGLTNNVGIGTPTPATKLEVAGQGISVGSIGNAVPGSAYVSETSGAGKYGIYGQSLGNDLASVYGFSATGEGVSGSAPGTGIYAMSLGSNNSAIAGTIASEYDPTSANKIAGIYASGLGGWAGYLEQRLYASEYVQGRKFVPNRLQQSNIPYVSAVEQRSLPHLLLTNPNAFAFDGERLWIEHDPYDNLIYVLDAKTGFLIDEFIPAADGTKRVRYIQTMTYEQGYIWAGGHTDSGTCAGYRAAILRIDPNTIDSVTGTYDMEMFYVGPCHDAVATVSSNPVVDMVYDDVTPGGPYFWTVETWENSGYADYGYGIGRLNLNDYSYMTPLVKITNPNDKCQSWDRTQCMDGIDNEGAITPIDKFDGSGSSTNVTNNPSAIGQSFTGNGQAIKSATFTLKKTTATGSVTAKIYAHSGVYGDSSVPTGAALATSNPVNVTRIPSRLTDMGLVFPSAYTTVAGTKYVVVLEFSGTGTVIAEVQTTSGHSGNASTYSSGAWAAQAANDYSFSLLASGDGLIDYGCDVAGNSLSSAASCGAAGGNWSLPNADPNCSADDAPTAPDERLDMLTVGAPSGIAFDRTDLWVSFRGLISGYDYPPVVVGEGFGRFNAANLSNNEVFCSAGPGRNPGDVVYDSVNDFVWLGYNPGDWNRNRAGIGAFNGSTGAKVGEMTQEAGGWDWNTNSEQILFDNQSTPGNLIIWSATYDTLQKANVTTGSNRAGWTRTEFYMPNGTYYPLLDTTTSGGPYLWTTNTHGASVTRVAISTSQFITYVLKGAYTMDSAFDGTNVWLPNSYGYSIAKVRASDGMKIGDYATGFKPKHILYDGTNIWTLNEYTPDNKALTKIRASDGVRLGDFSRTTSSSGSDFIYDGIDLWYSEPSMNRLHRIEPDTCVDADGGGPGVGSCPSATPFYTTVADGTNVQPGKLAFDGTSIWAAARNNRVVKFSLNGAVQSSFTIPQIDGSYYNGNIGLGNIQAMEYDGTFLWLGTYLVDGNGNSVYKISTASGTCSNSGNSCQTNANCGGGTCNAVVAGQYPIYHEPGKCSGGSNANNYCTRDSMCSGGGTCTGMISGVKSLTFDGTQVWVTNGSSIDSLVRRECDDGIDNDNDGRTDRYINLTTGDTDCLDGTVDQLERDSSTFFSTLTGTTITTDNECADGIDNDGNGLCDYNGAAGNPGCSGKPDPGCTSATTDFSEATSRQDGHLTRILAAENSFVESVRYKGNYCGASSSVFDGSHLWLTADGPCFNLQTAAQYYTGNGYGLDDLGGNINLQTVVKNDLAQPGSFSHSGTASVGAKLMVVGDLVMSVNTWEGAVDNLRAFGASCTDGEFVKGVDIINDQLHCRGL